MKVFLGKFKSKNKKEIPVPSDINDQIERQVAAMFDLLTDLYGADKLVLKAGKLDTLQLMRSERLEERVLALQKLVFEDPTVDTIPEQDAIPGILEEIENEIADHIARRKVEDQLEKKINEMLQKRHEEYVQEIKMQVLKDTSGPENALTLKKLAVLEKMEEKKLTTSAMEFLRPASFEEIVGQSRGN